MRFRPANAAGHQPGTRPGWRRWLLLARTAVDARHLPGARRGWRRWLLSAGTAVIVLALAGGAFAGSGHRSGPALRSLSSAARTSARSAADRSAARSGTTGSPLSRSTPVAPPAASAGAGTAVAGGPRTSCTSVAHIGDSTSADLISSGTLPDVAQQLPAQYSAVGAAHLLLDASGGRSIVEEMPGQVNGYKVATNWWNQGYRGCWVFALGTNDAANISVGSAVGMTARIDEMMSAAHGEPVLWVNTVTRLPSGPWSEANEQAWDSALASALARYPNMRIFNWAGVAQPGWFLSDGIHYDTPGCAARAHAIADALAAAFPVAGASSSRVVS